MPRKAGDWLNNDDIYSEINAKEKAMHADKPDGKARSADEMSAESTMLRPFFNSFEDIWS